MHRSSGNGRFASDQDKTSVNFREQSAVTAGLLDSAAAYTADESSAARSKLKRQMEAARVAAKELEAAAMAAARRASAATDQYVQHNAWKSVGVAALVGVFIGCCLLASSRR